MSASAVLWLGGVSIVASDNNATSVLKQLASTSILDADISESLRCPVRRARELGKHQIE